MDAPTERLKTYVPYIQPKRTVAPYSRLYKVTSRQVVLAAHTVRIPRQHYYPETPVGLLLLCRFPSHRLSCFLNPPLEVQIICTTTKKTLHKPGGEAVAD